MNILRSCGHSWIDRKLDQAGPKAAADYQTKVSGPLLDRIDLHVEVAARVAAARRVQTERYADAGVRTIADLARSDGVGRIHIAEALSYRRQAPRN